jgi:hypothetical protein
LKSSREPPSVAEPSISASSPLPSTLFAVPSLSQPPLRISRQTLFDHSNWQAKGVNRLHFSYRQSFTSSISPCPSANTCSTKGSCNTCPRIRQHSVLPFALYLAPSLTSTRQLILSVALRSHLCKAENQRPSSEARRIHASFRNASSILPVASFGPPPEASKQLMRGDWCARIAALALH